MIDSPNTRACWPCAVRATVSRPLTMNARLFDIANTPAGTSSGSGPNQANHAPVAIRPTPIAKLMRNFLRSSLRSSPIRRSVSTASRWVPSTSSSTLFIQSRRSGPCALVPVTMSTCWAATIASGV